MLARGRGLHDEKTFLRSKCLCRRRFPEFCPLVLLDALKVAFSKTGDPHFLRLFQAEPEHGVRSGLGGPSPRHNAGNATGKWALSSDQPGAKDALIVVDVQNDFCPGARLAVQKATEVGPW